MEAEGLQFVHPINLSICYPTMTLVAYGAHQPKSFVHMLIVWLSLIQKGYGKDFGIIKKSCFLILCQEASIVLFNFPLMSAVSASYRHIK